MELKVKGEKDNAKQNRTTSSEKVLVSPVEHQWSTSGAGVRWNVLVGKHCM